MPWKKEYQEKNQRIVDEVYLSGGQNRLEKEHEKGKLSARERLIELFDDGVFHEIDMLIKSRIEYEGLQKKHFWGDGVIGACGMVNGQKVFAVSQDCTISGGAGGESHINKICDVLELAIKTRCPIVYLCDSGGARIEEGIISLNAYSRLFRLNATASGMILQIASIMGNCAGGSSYSPAMCDLVFMVEKTSQCFITGPKVIKALTGETISMEELGGAEIHSKYSGQVQLVSKNDIENIKQIREVLGLFGIKKINQKLRGDDWYRKRGKQIEDIVPEYNRTSYDMRLVINNLVDDDFLELSSEFAKNIIIGLARLEGRTIGIVANQPNIMGGAIDCDAADKCARFVRTCDCFGIPLLVLVDVPGFYPGAAEEKKGILRHGSKMLYSFAEASVPKVTLIVRKAYGGAYCAMNSKGLGADFVFAWPLCEIAVMGADGAVDVMFGKTLSNVENSEQLRQEKIDKYEEKYLNPYYAASCGLIDEIIMPDETREKLISIFSILEGKESVNVEKKHGNIAL